MEREYEVVPEEDGPPDRWVVWGWGDYTVEGEPGYRWVRLATFANKNDANEYVRRATANQRAIMDATQRPRRDR